MTRKLRPEDIARSISDRLSRLAKKQNASFEALQSAFLLERMAARLLADKSLAKALIFKGGFVSLRVYSSPRYTNDLDALLRRGRLETFRTEATAAIETNLQDGVWFQFEESVDLVTQGEYGGLRLTFRAGIGPRPAKLVKARRLNLDIGTGDAVTPAPVETTLPLLLAEGGLSWSVYPLETMCSEKLHALIARGSENSRSKDVFDLSLFLPKCSAKSLDAALKATFKARGDRPPERVVEALEQIDTSILKRGWKAAMTGIQNAPDFDACFTTVAAQVKQLFGA